MLVTRCQTLRGRNRRENWREAPTQVEGRKGSLLITGVGKKSEGTGKPGIGHQITALASGGSEKRTYAYKYNAKWEKDPRFEAWIERSGEFSEKAFCKYCLLEIRSQVLDLKRHAD